MIWSLSKGWHSDDPKRDDSDGDGNGGAPKTVSAGDHPLARTTPANDGPATSVAIPVTMPGIKYEEKAAGYLRIEPGDPAMESPDGDTVLRLAFYLTYTEAGRSLLLTYTFDRDTTQQLPPGTTRAELKQILHDEFPALDDARLEIALDAHFAAGEYVAILETAPDPDQPKGTREAVLAGLQAIYRQRLAAMLGALYDDAMGRDFSCIW